MPTFDLLDLARVARQRWLRLCAWAFGLAVAGYLISFLVPAVYEARAVIFPPDDDELTSAFSSQRRSLVSLGTLSRLGAGSYFTQEDLALATLRSRSLRERVAERFDLAKVYKLKRADDVDKELRGNSRIVIGNDGTIAVTVRDHDRRRAADMANAFLTTLDDVNRVFRTSRARRTRQFLEARVAQTDSSLRAAEAGLTRYQGRRGAVVLPPESGGTSAAGASLLAEQLRAEVEFSMVATYASPQSEEYRRAQRAVEELRRQIGLMPATQAGAAELVRQVALQQQVLALLTSQLEDARIREVMDTPTIQVLDWAKPPERHSWPRRSLIAAFGFLVGLGVGGILVWRSREPILREA